MELFSAEFFSVVGFPAGICVYVLFTVNRNLKHLTDAVTVLNGNINHLVEKIDDMQTEFKMQRYGNFYQYHIHEDENKVSEHNLAAKPIS